MDLVLIHKIALVLINAFGLGLAFWVYRVNRRNKINQLFSLYTLSMLLYLSFSYLSHYSAEYQQALLWKRLFLAAVSLFLIFAYFFSVYFPREGKRYPVLDKIVLVTETSFIFLTIFTNLIIEDIEFQDWGTNIIFGPGKNIFFGLMVVFTFLIVGQVFKKYFSLSPRKKLQTQYFLIGAFIFAPMNIIFNMIFPAWKDTYKYHYWGDYSAIFFLGIVALGIVRRELFGIKVILTDLLVGIMGIVLFVIPFLIGIVWLKILLFITFFFFCIIGYLLIRYTHREAKQKETLEQKVQERTKELEERTEESERRAGEIQKRKEDLERFYNLTVGRELKMIELKEKIKELEEKIEQ